MVLLDRIELSTSPLPMECSTTELQQRTRMRDTCHSPSPFATLQTRHGLDRVGAFFHVLAMANKPRTPRSTAETKRLAEALRINLLKRKSLARLKKTIAKVEKKASD